MAKYLQEMNKEEIKEIMKQFYENASPEQLLRLAIEMGLYDSEYSSMFDIASILKLDIDDHFQNKAENDKYNINSEVLKIGVVSMEIAA